ncbi:unnamed protein product [Adineta steineri]|uniref:Uncharacterized protein n=1 Tax=Adineta steineri TaxID=433720 RepID=A0A814CL25_9BILA|nr:unnamed protein product [Adineta steineri]CAF4011748.1 unnamed protein product [Adineta steineri]
MISFSDHSYKLLVVGDKGVGKTLFSTVNSILNSEEWKIDYVGYKERKKEINLNGERIKLTIEYDIQSNISMFEVSALDFTNVEPAFEHMILKIRSNSTSRINHQPDQYSKRIDLEFVYHISNIDPNVAEQNVTDQDLHDGAKNENEQISIKKKAMQSNIINLSKTFESFCIEKVNELKYLLKLYNVTFNLTITMC